MSKTTEKKERTRVSSKDYDYLDKKITSGEGTFEYMQKKREEIKKNMLSKKEKTNEQETKYQEIKENFLRKVFLLLQKGLNNAKIANEYLFEVIKKRLEGKLKGEIYKVQVVHKDEKGIRCIIKGENRYVNEIHISNKEIMESKPSTDILETAIPEKKYVYNPKLSQEANEYFRKKQPKSITIKPEDFLDEIQRRDSVIIKSEKGKLIKLEPEEIINEIGTYLKQQGERKKSADKINTALSFINEANEELATEYIQEIMRFFKEKKRKRKLKGNESENRKYFGEILKRFINSKNIYFHKEDDIDKSASEFLLRRLGIVKKDKEFQGINHDEVDTLDEGIFIDIGGTATGLKITQKKEQMMTEQGKKVIKTKTKIIGSEHSDKTIEAMFKTRPTSTTQIIFKIFKELGQIKKEELPQIQRFVNFINIIDNMEYQISSVDYPNNYQTMFGLYRFIPIHMIFNYFADPEHTGFEKLPERYLQSITIKKKKDNQIITTTLLEESKEQKARIQKDIENFQKLKKRGDRELNYKGVPFIVDIEDAIKKGPQTAGYHGYGFFKIFPKKGNIYIYSPKKLPEKIQGYPTDGHFLIIDHPTTEDIKTLFKEFSTRKIKETSLEKEMIAYLKSIRRKKDTAPMTEETLKYIINKHLPPLKPKDIQIGKTYKGIVNNVQNNLIFISINKDGTIYGTYRIKNKDKERQIKKGDIVEVKIESLQENDRNQKTQCICGSIKKTSIPM